MHEFDIAKDPLGIIYGGKLCEMGRLDLNIARARVLSPFTEGKPKRLIFDANLDHY